MNWASLLFVLAVVPLSATEYTLSLSGAGSGFGSLFLNSTSTGGQVDIQGQYTGSGLLLNNVLVGGALVPNDAASFPFPNFDYHGTIFFTVPCCNFDFFYVDTNATLGGQFTLSQPAPKKDPPTPPITRPPDVTVPEPATIVLAGAGLATVSVARRRSV